MPVTPGSSKEKSAFLVKFIFHFFNLSERFLFRKRKLLIWLFCLSVIFLLLKVISRRLSLSCLYEDRERSIRQICDDYDSGKALGNACAEICDSNFLHTSSCLPHHLGKDVVFVAYYKGQKIVVKSSKLNADSLDQIFWTHEGAVQYPDLEMFYRMVLDNLKINLNINDLVWKGKEALLIKELWNNSLELSNLKIDKLNIAMNNVWSLLQQPEYMFLKYHETSSIFPKVLGTCRHFYIVEHIHSIDNLFMVLYPSWRIGFSVRATLALKILDYVEVVALRFPDLHICDMKVGHFGLDNMGKIKLLDVDMVFFTPSLIENILAVKQCDTDEECSFINCKASCEKQKQRCIPRVLNTNFQRVCSNIFHGKFFGLLSFPPSEIADTISNILEMCSSQPYNISVQRTVSSQLRQLLSTVASG